MNLGIYIGSAFIIWSILLHDKMGTTPMICATIITITAIICDAWRSTDEK